jgi:hypothetical protein
MENWKVTTSKRKANRKPAFVCRIWDRIYPGDRFSSFLGEARSGLGEVMLSLSLRCRFKMLHRVCCFLPRTVSTRFENLLSHCVLLIGDTERSDVIGRSSILLTESLSDTHNSETNALRSSEFRSRKNWYKI